MFIENLFPPIPSEVVLLFSGSLVAQGSLSLGGVLIASIVGSLLGALTIYAIGVWSDERIIRSFIRRYGRFLSLEERELDTALNVFIRYGPSMVFFGRVIPIIRSIISLPAGIKRMKMRQFLLFTVLGTAVWNTVTSHSFTYTCCNNDRHASPCSYPTRRNAKPVIATSYKET